MINFSYSRSKQVVTGFLILSFVFLGSLFVTTKTHAATSDALVSKTLPLLVSGAGLAVSAMEERSKSSLSVASDQKILELVARLKELVALYQSMLAQQQNADVVRPVDSTEVKNDASVRPEFYLEVSSPNGGEVFDLTGVDELMRIKYDTNLPEGVKLLVSLDKAIVGSLVTNSEEVNENGDTSLDLGTIDGLTEGNVYRISLCAPEYRTSPVDERPLCDKSDNFFRIITDPAVVTPQQELEVIYPNGGETLTMGQSHILKWSSTGIGEDELIALYLMKSNGDLHEKAFATVRNTGRYTYVMNDYYSIQPGNYKLYIATPPDSIGSDRQTISDTSDDYFAIVEGIAGTIDPIKDSVQ